ncbi:MAG: hypothetical protein COA86_08950 [Kangiella sp.]|nr:MAG: hypothetical protein COA86_08950 [Kangiella sp.]
MNIYKNKVFDKWATKEGIDNEILLKAIKEIESGLFDANLGGNIVKKRVAVGGRGKSGGVRTLLAYQFGNKAFFVYGFAKNVRANIKEDELKALKLYANTLLGYSDKELTKAVQAGVLFEIKNNG